MPLPRFARLLLTSLVVWAGTADLADADARKDKARAASAAWEAAYNARDIDLLMQQYREAGDAHLTLESTSRYAR